MVGQPSAIVAFSLAIHALVEKCMAHERRCMFYNQKEEIQFFNVHENSVNVCMIYDNLITYLNCICTGRMWAMAGIYV